MPNHTSTILTITGPNEDITRFVAQAGEVLENGETVSFSFDKFLPMPEEIRNSSSPVSIQTQAEIDEIWAKWNALPENERSRYQKIGYAQPFGLGITQETYNSLIEKYSCSNWYDWANTYWGTKWGAYDAGTWKVEDGRAEVYYQTAWSPATPFYLKVSQNFPTLTFTHEFADEGGGFLGSETVQNGKVTQNIELKWDSPEGVELRRKLGCYYEGEED